MSFINSNIQNVQLWGDFNSYHISHDGEGDDIQALIIASDALKDKGVEVDCVIGNPDIVHFSADKAAEMEARMKLTNEVFGAQIAICGAHSNNEVSEKYVSGILEQSPEKKCLVLHTDSFKSLQALFNRAKPGQLNNVVLLTYGSVNLSWAMPKPHDYQIFYDSLAASGAKLVQIEAFPFLGTRNKLTHKNTPLTYSLLRHLDGPVGEKWATVNAGAAEKVRSKQAGKIAEYICQGMEKVSGEQRDQLYLLVSQIAILLGNTIDKKTFTDPTNLQSILDKSLVGEQHDHLVEKLEELKKFIVSVLEENEANLARV